MIDLVSMLCCIDIVNELLSNHLVTWIFSLLSLCSFTLDSVSHLMEGVNLLSLTFY